MQGTTGVQGNTGVQGITGLRGVTGISSAGQFGVGYQNAESLSSSTTTSTTYTNKVTLTTPSLPAGRYLVGFYSELTTDNASRSFGVRLGVDTASVILAEISQKPGTAGEFTAFGGVVEVTLTAAVHTFEIDFKVSGSAAPITIQRSTVSIWQAS